jgi:hypothetical protein
MLNACKNWRTNRAYFTLIEVMSQIIRYDRSWASAGPPFRVGQVSAPDIDSISQSLGRVL